jgi:hypothetical protein
MTRHNLNRNFHSGHTRHDARESKHRQEYYVLPRCLFLEGLYAGVTRTPTARDGWVNFVNSLANSAQSFSDQPAITLEKKCLRKLLVVLSNFRPAPVSSRRTRRPSTWDATRRTYPARMASATMRLAREGSTPRCSATIPTDGSLPGTPFVSSSASTTKLWVMLKRIPNSRSITRPMVRLVWLRRMRTIARSIWESASRLLFGVISFIRRRSTLYHELC